MLNDTTKHTETDTTHTNGNGHVAKQPDPVAVLANLEKQLDDLKKQIARGTRNDVQAPAEVRRPDLAARIEHALRGQICTTEELARSVGEPAAKVQERLKALRKNLADVGTADQARWVWRVGDETPAKELRDLVQRLIEDQPLTTAQLTKITGARMSRVNGVLVEIQRTPDVAIYNLGSDYRARWWVMPKGAKPANLPPKGAKK